MNHFESFLEKILVLLEATTRQLKGEAIYNKVKEKRRVLDKKLED